MSTLLNASRIHIEISSKCTVKCPRCPRTELRPDSLNKEITLGEFKSAFDPTTLSKINDIVFCGDIGDPIYARDFLNICRYIKDNSNTIIRITTNGSYKSTEWWTELGQLLTANDRVTFSVDGVDQQTNEQYRVNSDYDSIINGMRSLRESSSCVMIWSAIYFNFNENLMDQIQQLAKSLGFNRFKAVRSSKFDQRYLINGIDPLKPKLENVANGSPYEEEIVEFIPYTNLSAPIRNYHPWARCLNWSKELFINVDGLVFPCPWFNNGYQSNDFVQKYKDKINIKTRTLTDILADPLWEELVKRFDDNPLNICQLKCKNA